MDESTIGKVLFVGIVGLVIWGITALLQAKSEVARRFRFVVGGALGLVAAWVWFMMVGPVGFVITLGLVGAGLWIVKGSKK